MTKNFKSKVEIMPDSTDTIELIVIQILVYKSVIMVIIFLLGNMFLVNLLRFFPGDLMNGNVGCGCRAERNIILSEGSSVYHKSVPYVFTSGSDILIHCGILLFLVSQQEKQLTKILHFHNLLLSLLTVRYTFHSDTKFSFLPAPAAVCFAFF